LIERCTEPGDPPARRSIVGEDQNPRNRCCLPASIEPDPWRESRLAIDSSECRLDVGDDGLDLDHEQRLRPSVPSEDVDRPPLRPYLERDLRDGLPTGVPEPPQGPLDEAAVTVLEEAVEVLPLAQDSQVDTCAEGRGDPFEETERKLVGAATVDPRDGLR
jgi:hypothetical protein